MLLQAVPLGNLHPWLLRTLANNQSTAQHSYDAVMSVLFHVIIDQMC